MFISNVLRIGTFTVLQQFGKQNPTMIPAIAAWYKIAKSKDVDWKKPQDVVATFGPERVDILQNDKVCIDVGGKNLRIILKVEYGHHIAFVRWIGWHKDYSRLGNKIHTL